MRRPLLGLMGSAVGGMLLGASCSVPLPALLVGCWLLALAALAQLRGRGGTATIHLLVLALAWLHTVLTAHPPSSRELTALMRREREHVELVAVVSDDPLREPARSGDGIQWRFPARVDAVRRAGGWERAGGRLDVRWETTNTALNVAYGERWRLAGPAIELPERRGSPPVCRLEVLEDDARLLDRGHGSRLRTLCLTARRACARTLASGLADFPDAVGIVQALMLGYRHELAPRAEDAFRRTGTLHIVAISGAHVGMVALFFLVALKATGCPQQRWIFALGPMLLAYALSTGMAPSALRACIMATVFWSAYLFRRQPDAPSALALAALLILAVSPGQLWQPGFLLSFCVVAGLVLFYPVLVRPLHALADRDPWQAQGEARWRRWLRAGLRQLGSLAAVSTAAWLVSTPLTAHFFNLFSPVALLANLVVVPMAFVILLTGCLSLVSGALHPLAAEVFNHANRVFVACLLYAVEAFHRWPAGHWFVEAPPRWAVALWLACVAGLLLGHRRVRAAAAMVAAIGLLGGAAWYVADQRVRIDTTAMGPVNVVFCNLPGSGDLLIDTGPAWMHQRLTRFLRARGVDRLHALVLSRATIDAGGGALELARQVPMSEVWIPDVASRSPPFTRMIADLEQRGIAVRRMAQGDRGVAAGGAVWEVLHPRRGVTYRRAADAGLVLRIARGPASLLYQGHASPEVEALLLDAPVDVGAAALVAGTLSGDGAWGRAWLDLVRPSDVVLPAHAARLWNAAYDDLAPRIEAAGGNAHPLVDDLVATVTFAPPRARAEDPLVTVTMREARNGLR